MDEIDEIVSKLTKAQRDMMTGDARAIGNPSQWILCSDRAMSRTSVPTRTVLTRLNLIAPTRFGPNVLTDLGLAVRTRLERTA